MKEKPVRSIVKALSWRLTATIVTVIATLIITGRIEYAISIGAIDLVAKLCIYYFHERLWNNIKFGLEKEKKPEYYI